MKKTQPRINPAAIELLTRVFNSHKKGLPEWMKNAREAYLRAGVPRENRHIILHYVPGKKAAPPMLECIDFVGISGQLIHDNYIEWANPEAAKTGLKPGEAEGGQGNGGKAYLREGFEQGYFISIANERLSVVGFTDPEKYILDFLPDDQNGRDIAGDSSVLKGIRKYAQSWLEAFDLPKSHGITIVRGIGPKKAIDPDRLLLDIQQFPQARETVNACVVDFYVDLGHRRELNVKAPELHPAFSKPIKIPVPLVIEMEDGTKVATTRTPEFGPGTLDLCISEAPLQGAQASWNRIDFHAGGVSVVAFKKSDELPLKFGAFSRHLFGSCDVPLLKDPKDNYELQGRVSLNEGPLSGALYKFIAEEADKVLGQLAKQAAGATAQKKRKNLEKLHQRLTHWIEAKLSSLAGLSETGGEEGLGKAHRKKREMIQHEPAVELKVHRDKLDICAAVTYPLRALAYDAQKRPVPPGKVVWRSSDLKVASVHPESGVLTARAPGILTVAVSNANGLMSAPMIITVHEPTEITIKATSPAKVGTNRRLPLQVVIKSKNGKSVPKDTVVSWRSDDERIAAVGPDGNLIGGEVGETAVTAYAGQVESSPLAVSVEHGAGGKPRSGGKGKPSIRLSGQDPCPWGSPNSYLDPSDPPVYQRLGTPDYDNNVFWINLQHPLPAALMDGYGEESVQWRSYHAQRIVDVFTILALRSQYGDAETDVDTIIEEMQTKAATIFEDLKDEIFDVVFKDDLDFRNV